MPLQPQCPPDDQLDAVARGNPPSPDLRDHIDACETCRAKIEQARANESFLEQFRATYRKPTPTTHAPPPDQLRVMPGYHVRSVIASGGQGVIYDATHVTTGRRVAIKMLNRQALANERQRRRFEREIEIAAHLRHPNIVTLYETRSLEDGSVAFAMEFVDGLPLDEWRPAGPDPLTQRLRLFLEICGAVQHAHQHGIIHRDLKPANILIDRSDEPRVLDFGVAKSVTDDAGVSLTGEFVGTLAYAAPEQVRRSGEYADTRTDVYALGLLLFKLLTGAHPYHAAGSMQQIIRNISDTPPTRPSTLDDSLGDEIDAILVKTLAKDPDRRYQSVDALADDIRRFLHGEPIAAKHDSTWYVLRKTATRFRLPIGIAAAFVVLLTALAATMTYQRFAIARERDRTTQALAVSNIERARILAREGNVAEADRLIWSARRSLARNEARQLDRDEIPTLISHWALWDLYAHNPCLATAHAGDSPITNIRASRDAHLLASCHQDGSINLWSLPGLGHLRRITAHTGPTHDAIFDPAGSTLTSIGAEGRIVTSDIQSGSTLGAFDTSPSRPLHAAIAASGDHFAAAETDGSVTLRSLTSGEVVARSTPIEGRIKSIAIDDDAELIALSRMSYASAIMLEPTEDTALSPSTLALMDDVVSIAFGADRDIALGGFATGLSVMAREDREPVSEPTPLKGHREMVSAVAFSDDARLLASASRDQTVRIWDAERRMPISVLRGHDATPSHVLLAGDQPLVISTGPHTIKVWELRPNLGTTELSAHTSTITWLAFTPDGSRVVSSAYDGTVRTWSVADRAFESTLRPKDHAEGINAAALSPDGVHLATTGHTKNRLVHLWSLPEQRRLWSAAQPHELWISWIEFSPDTRTIASAGQSEIFIHDLATGRHTATLFKDVERPHHFAFSPDGQRLVCGDTNGHITALSLDQPDAPLWTTPVPPKERCIVHAPDAGLIASAGESTIIRLLDPHSGESVAALEGHAADVFTIAFSPDARLLASGSRDGIIKLWDVEHRRELITFHDHSRGVFTLAFSPDGTLLASGGEDTIVRIHDLTYYDNHIAGNERYHSSLEDD